MKLDIKHWVVVSSVATLLVFNSQGTLADAAAGKGVYEGTGGCVACHGLSGQGDGPAAMAMNPKPRSFVEGVFLYDTDGDGQTGTDADLVNIIKNGSAKYGGAPTMPGRADIPDGDIKAIVAYLRSFKK
ncbi:MAG: c-type cytochrome [Candidatus Thiodiazotropha sp. (ex Cardiolucina cf. quadrata)]|nr:c-type cytochrome [Candidatus Thiodiazotropha sp. (ex Cardiolucina cf. quadrata)]